MPQNEYRNLIGGQWRAARSGKTFANVNPADHSDIVGEFPASGPEDVADAIVSTLRKPRFEVFVPRSVGTMGKLTRLLPRRAGEALARVLKADQLLASAAHSPARADYEARAAESAPGASQE